MYCIKCGVELSPGQSTCPVCGTRVYHPDLPVSDVPPPYPRKEFQPEEFNRKGILFVITIIALLPLLLPMVFEFSWHGVIEWSGYVAGAVVLLYVAIVLPLWFKKPNPVVFVPCDFAVIAVYLLYINFQTGGNWFFSFAFPVAGGLGVIITAIVALAKYLRRTLLYVFGGGLIAIGAWTVLIELLVRVTFGVRTGVMWSLCTLISFFVLGMMLIIIELVKPLKESLRKIFFIG